MFFFLLVPNGPCICSTSPTKYTKPKLIPGVHSHRNGVNFIRYLCEGGRADHISQIYLARECDVLTYAHCYMQLYFLFSILILSTSSKEINEVSVSFFHSAPAPVAFRLPISFNGLMSEMFDFV